jgi:photosystem II stability/assembly factor-like uncharacterized protein
MRIEHEMKSILCILLPLLIFMAPGGTLHSQWKHTDTLCSGNVNDLISMNGLVFACTKNGIFRSSDNGIHWSTSNTGLPANEVMSFGTLGTLMTAGTSTAGIFLSNDHGLHWNSASGGLSISNVTAFAERNSLLYACFHDTLYQGCVYRTDDSGRHWNSISSGITNGDARAIALCDSGMLLGTMGGVFFSSDGGTQWTPRNSGLSVVYVDALLSCGTAVFAGTMTGGAYRSTDRGLQWERINTGLTNTYVNALAATRIGVLFAGTGWSGVFFSTNNGNEWHSANAGLTTSQINALAVDSAQNVLYAATDDGVWYRPISEIVTEVPEHATPFPEAFELLQNYPNPFNPSTTIRYALPVAAHVQLTVHDVLGRKIATVMNEEQPAGWNTVQWNADGISGGIYFYTILVRPDSQYPMDGKQTDEYRETRKLLIVK